MQNTSRTDQARTLIARLGAVSTETSATVAPTEPAFPHAPVAWPHAPVAWPHAPVAHTDETQK